MRSVGELQDGAALVGDITTTAGEQGPSKPDPRRKKLRRRVANAHRKVVIRPQLDKIQRW